MNHGQFKAYRAEVAKWREACQRLGRPCDDEARRALHAECRAPASSKAFTNAQLDRVLAKLRSFSAMDNLAAQLRPEADSAARVARAQNDCRAAIVVLTGAGASETHRENYLADMARRICRCEFSDLNEAQILKLRGVLTTKAGAATVPDAEWRVAGGVDF